MCFDIEPKTWFLTNRDLRNALGLDYEYVCIDPMGADKQYQRAYLDLEE